MVHVARIARQAQLDALDITGGTLGELARAVVRLSVRDSVRVLERRTLAKASVFDVGTLDAADRILYRRGLVKALEPILESLHDGYYPERSVAS